MVAVGVVLSLLARRLAIIHAISWERGLACMVPYSRGWSVRRPVASFGRFSVSFWNSGRLTSTSGILLLICNISRNSYIGFLYISLWKFLYARRIYIVHVIPSYVATCRDSLETS